MTDEKLMRALSKGIADVDQQQEAADRIEALERETAPALAEARALPEDVRKWQFYPIQMPFTADGKGPATVGVDAVEIAYEVWDTEFNSHASFDNLPDAINEAMRLTLAALDEVRQDDIH